MGPSATFFTCLFFLKTNWQIFVAKFSKKFAHICLISSVTGQQCWLNTLNITKHLM